ncbi:MAG TPA: nodulation protein NfeD, partial [Chitinophagaceae bacterium]
MRKVLFVHFILLIAFSFTANAQRVIVINIDGSINPASASFIERSIKKAQNEKAQCLVIKLNTPGGLLKSTRVIVGQILDAPLPVVVYISPGGAHAGSAGVFITMAAHIAAMAPGTNIGAAHPVGLQGGMDTTMDAKATNDAAAFIRTIAEKRHRNIQWAEKAVLESASITATEAVEEGVVDLVASSFLELLDQIHGKMVVVSSGPVSINTKGTAVKALEMSFIEKVLNILSDPNIAYILLMLGFYGILFELYNPGAILPGIIGVIGLILGFYSLHTLPINYAGLFLIVFGIILFLLEIKITSYGMLTIGGVISLLLGSMMLIRDDPSFEFARISLSVIISTTVVSAIFFVFIIGMGLRAQRKKPVTGLDGFLREIGTALEPLDPEGTVQVHGEIWQAESTGPRIEKGEKIRITAIKNFKLYVE